MIDDILLFLKESDTKYEDTETLIEDKDGRLYKLYLYPDDEGYFYRVYNDRGEILRSRNAGKLCDSGWVYDKERDTDVKILMNSKPNNKIPKGYIARVDENDKPFYSVKDDKGYHKIYLNSSLFETHQDNEYLTGAGFIEEADYYKYGIDKEEDSTLGLTVFEGTSQLSVKELFPEPLGYEKVYPRDYDLVKIENDKPAIDLDEVVNMASDMYYQFRDEVWYKFNETTLVYDQVHKNDVIIHITSILDNTPNAPSIKRNLGSDMYYMLWTKTTEKKIMDRLKSRNPILHDNILKEYTGELVRFNNCILNKDTGKMLPHTPYFFTTSKYDAIFDPNIQEHPVEEIYKNIIKDPKTLEFFFEAVGYTIFSDEMKPPMILLIYGQGETGKSALVETVRKVLGNDNVSNLNLSQLSAEFGTINLVGKKMNLSSETGNKGFGGIFDKGTDGDLLKQLADGTVLTHNRKFRSSLSEKNTAKMWFVSNSLPNFGDTTSGLYRRLYIIPCRAKQRWDDQIYDKMQTRDALAWLINQALKGYLRLKDRKMKFDPSDEMLHELLQYRRLDNLTDFLVERYEVETVEEIRDFLDGKLASELYNEYCEYVSDAGARPSARKTIVEKIRNEYEMGYTTENYYDDMGRRTSGRMFRKDL